MRFDAAGWGVTPAAAGVRVARGRDGRKWPTLVARAQGFESWSALAQFAASVPAGKRTIAAKAVAVYSLDESGVTHAVARSHDWDEIFEMIRERRLSGLHATGQMTDGLMDRLSRLDHITHLDLDGSRG